MRSKRNRLAFMIFTGIILLAGVLSFTLESHMIVLRNCGTLDLSGRNGSHAVALIEKGGLEYAHIQVFGANCRGTLALRIPPYFSARRVFVDGQSVASRDGNEAAATNPVSRYAAETFEFVPPDGHFDLTIQTAQSGVPLFGSPSVIHIGTIGQIERLNSAISGCDIFTIAFLIVVICYNIFYYFIRKDLFFLVFILMCLLMCGRTIINGSFLLGSLFPNVTFQTALSIESITMLFLPACWLSITYFSNVVTLPKAAVVAGYFYGVASSLISFALPASTTASLSLLAESVWLITAGYVIVKSLEAVMVKKLNKSVAYLLLSGVMLLTLCSVLNLFQYRLGKGPLDLLPIGLILYTLLWDYSYTYQYDLLLKDRLKVLEDLNAAYENGRSLEMKFLRSQIRPHFINNVLNSIIAVSLTDAERSRELLCYFSTYLKSCYDFGEPYSNVTLEHELTVVKAYIALEKARFADSLHVEFKIDTPLIEIPPLILQSLVENAIKHNTISKKSPLSIWIYAIHEGEAVKIGVGDSGRGFDSNMIPLLLNGEPNSRGVGIYNVNQRLTKIYGTVLRIENRKNGGCDVYTVIPNKNGINHLEPQSKATPVQ